MSEYGGRNYEKSKLVGSSKSRIVDENMHRKRTALALTIVCLMVLSFQLGMLVANNSNDVSTSDFVKRINKDYGHLAIGNSITTHPITEYWWANDGMAASIAEKDYFHLVVSDLSDRYGSVNAATYSFFAWEVTSHDRSEAYMLIDEYLISGINLVTIQLSENCSDLTTFELDLKALINHIIEKCGDDTQIIVIDDFWSLDKHEIKKTVCEELEIQFVDLSDFYSVDTYKAGVGTIVYGEDGEAHIIEHKGVANHPGDEGMKIIAERVINAIK